MVQSNGKLKVRPFVSLILALSGLGLPVTGIASHIYWHSGLTATRHAWMMAHFVLGLLLAIFAIWHVALNRHTLWNHLKNAAACRSIVGP